MFSAKQANILTVRKMSMDVMTDGYVRGILKEINTKIRDAINLGQFGIEFTTDYLPQENIIVVEKLRKNGFTVRLDPEVYYDKQTIHISWHQPDGGF